MNNLVEQGRTLTDIAREHISDEPLNDVGPTRIISFNALDIDWTIEFPNSYIMNAIGEEFISILQVFLSEIARTGRDLLTKGRTIIIHVREGRDYERIKKHERMDDWLAVIPAFSSKEQPKISYHYAFISLMLKEVFLEIAATTEERFDEFWWALHEREKIGDRAFCTNTYQKVYRNAVGEDSFDKSQRAAFNPLPPHTVFTESPKYLPA
jgi:hypothetical protein